MNEKPKRKPTRLKNYDYSLPGAYFVTICTENRKEILSRISVGDDAHIVPSYTLTACGEVCKKHIDNIALKYKNIFVDTYIIMPNHIHMIIFVSEMTGEYIAGGCGHPPLQTNNISHIVRTFKTMVTKEMKKSIWQRSFHDHIIRNKADYQKIWEYIDTNIQKWEEDCFF